MPPVHHLKPGPLKAILPGSRVITMVVTGDGVKETAVGVPQEYQVNPVKKRLIERVGRKF